MLKYLVLTVLLAGGAACIVCAQQKPETINIPVDRTPASDGKAMYVSYCAPCHGVDGQGKGPVASSLKTQPANLALLSRSNQGKYPMNHVLAVLNFGVNTPAHGTDVMPIWGPMLGRMNDKLAFEQQERTLRINNLVRYMEALQVK